MFKANGKFKGLSNDEFYIQNETVVPGTRLDTWAKKNNIDCIDLIWMDLQGAEYLALKGLGDMIKNVRGICVELTTQEMYTGQYLYYHVNPFLHDAGFHLIAGDPNVEWQGDFVYGNGKFMNVIA